MWKRGWREEVWGKLNQAWDLIVIGGGITGAGILAEATRHGLKVLLLEGNDFASGTSSRSTKLVHGGLRYLRQAQIRVTRESVVERENLLREGGGLVTPLGFCLASFRGDQMPGWMFGAGLAIYDILAKKWAHSRINKSQLLQRFPSLEGAALKAAYHYYDAQTDDARLVVRVIREAVTRGGTALNYAKAVGLLRDASGKVVGVAVEDGPTGKTAEVRAKVVISATGAWADDLRTKLGVKKKLRAIRGSHLIFPAERLPLAEAISLLHPRDGRAVFAIPWEGITLLGTTDVDHHEDLSVEPGISTKEVEYILEAAHHAFPTRNLAEKDVRSTFAGVRSVIDTGASDPSKESREHALWREEGLLTVTGGKLTTFRLMAREALHAVKDALPQLGHLGARTRILEDGNAGTALGIVDDETKARLLGRHGAETVDVLSMPERDELVGDSKVLWGELRWAARSEGVVHLDDLLLRRARVGLLSAGGGLRDMERIRAIAQPELGWDDATWEKEATRYAALWRRCYGDLGT